MIIRLFKWGLIACAGGALVASAVLGKDVVSYAQSGYRSVVAHVRGQVPIEFELRRARDLLNDIVPEMHSNIRLIAQQEVEIAQLRRDITEHGQAIRDERARMAKIRDYLSTEQVSFSVGNCNYSRDQLAEDLARRLDQTRESETVLAGKQKLLETRMRALAASVQTLDKTRAQKQLLEHQIAALEAQHKVLQAAAVGSTSEIDDTKLAQTQRLIDQVKRQLDVAERVLANESRFIQPIQVHAVDEKELMSEVDEFLAARR